MSEVQFLSPRPNKASSYWRLIGVSPLHILVPNKDPWQVNLILILARPGAYFHIEATG
jgi:hypothetical protein